MDLIKAVPGNVLAELFEIAAFADLALGVQPERSSIQKKRRELFALGEQVRIHAKLALDSANAAMRPKSKRRRGFEVDALNRVISTLSRQTGPFVPRPFRRWRQTDDCIRLLRIDLLRERQSQSELASALLLITNPQFDFSSTIL